MSQNTEGPRIGEGYYRQAQPDLQGNGQTKGNPRNPLFRDNREASVLAAIDTTAIAHVPTQSTSGEEAQIVIIDDKLYPYLRSHDLMIMTFGNRDIPHVAECRDDLFPIGQAYMQTLQHSLEATVEYLSPRINNGERIEIFSSTNFAPDSKFHSPFNVQSVLTPHSHIIGATPEDKEGMQAIKRYTGRIEQRKFDGNYSATMRLYRDILAELFPTMAFGDERERTSFNDIGNSPLRRRTFGQWQRREYRTFSKNQFGGEEHKSPEKIDLPVGFSFTLERGLQDVGSPAFLQKMIAINTAMRRTYYALASIFIENVQDISNIGNSREQSTPLRLNSPEEQHRQLEAFLSRHHLSTATEHRLRRFIALSNSIIERGDTNTLGNFLTRGYAYSMVLKPIQWDKPQGKWQAIFTPFLYGGGGMEAMGIEKVKQTVGTPQNEELVASHRAASEERQRFRTHILTSLKQKDPSVVARV
ncbi:MAG TPA: hypothetical protein VFQ63_03430 [Patescibacteria group bacterium]|nr:hypothetical protein [Patescibacteria group bacterium]